MSLARVAHLLRMRAVHPSINNSSAMLHVALAGLLASAIASSAGCAESHGDVFVGVDGAAGSANTCLTPPRQIPGDDPSLVHACGEDCDSDWCNCESCLVQSGSDLSLVGGDYMLTIVGGSSGPVRYEFAVIDRDSGAVLASETVLYDHTLFEHHLAVSIPAGCHRLSLIIRQLDPFCSRIYETLIGDAGGTGGP